MRTPQQQQAIDDAISNFINNIKNRWNDQTTYTEYDLIKILELLHERMIDLDQQVNCSKKPENRNFWSLIQLNTQYVDALHEIKEELQRGNYIRIGKIIRDALGEPEPGK